MSLNRPSPFQAAMATVSLSSSFRYRAYALDFRSHGGATLVAAPMPFVWWHSAAQAVVHIATLNVMLARTFVREVLCLRDSWVCKFLVVRSSQQCFRFKIPDCTLHASYNCRPCDKSQVRKFFFFPTDLSGTLWQCLNTI